MVGLRVWEGRGRGYPRCAGPVSRVARHINRSAEAQEVANRFRARPDLARSSDKDEGSDLVRAYLLIDAALDSSYNELSSQLAEVESRELRHVEQALERIREGEYGVCERCSLKIPVARLNALPYATSCIECQREMEREAEAGGYSADWSRLLDNSDGDADLTINDIEIDVP